MPRPTLAEVQDALEGIHAKWKHLRFSPGQTLFEMAREASSKCAFCHLMAEYYKHLESGKGNALRKAKLYVREMDREGMSLAHPFFWAPFIVVGDGG